MPVTRSVSPEKPLLLAALLLMVAVTWPTASAHCHDTGITCVDPRDPNLSLPLTPDGDQAIPAPAIVPHKWEVGFVLGDFFVTGRLDAASIRPNSLTAFLPPGSSALAAWAFHYVGAEPDANATLDVGIEFFADTPGIAWTAGNRTNETLRGTPPDRWGTLHAFNLRSDIKHGDVFLPFSAWAGSESRNDTFIFGAKPAAVAPYDFTVIWVFFGLAAALALGWYSGSRSASQRRRR